MQYVRLLSNCESKIKQTVKRYVGQVTLMVQQMHEAQQCMEAHHAEDLTNLATDEEAPAPVPQLLCLLTPFDQD